MVAMNIIFLIKSFQIHYAQSGAAALALLEELDPAVVVADQRMPGMLGHELAAKLKETSPSTPVILVSGFNDRINKENCHEFQFSNFLMKPANPDELEAAIRSAIEKG